MKTRILSTLAIFSLIFATNLLTACDDDDDDDSTPTAGKTVDLGLSVKWADRNVGASSSTDCGYYYAFGEITTKSEYSVDNSVTYGDEDLNSISGDATYDAATANWGSEWRMPTVTEFKELIDDCEWNWESNGFRVTGSNGNSIFLPAAGGYRGTSLDSYGEEGMYWSSIPNKLLTKAASVLYIDSDTCYTGLLYRNYGLSVRPVSD